MCEMPIHLARSSLQAWRVSRDCACMANSSNHVMLQSGAILPQKAQSTSAREPDVRFLHNSRSNSYAALLA